MLTDLSAPLLHAKHLFCPTAEAEDAAAAVLLMRLLHLLLLVGLFCHPAATETTDPHSGCCC